MLIEPTKLFEYSDKEKIWVFDNLFTFAERAALYEFFLGSRFSFDRGAFPFPEAGSNVFQLRSTYNDSDVKNSKFFDNQKVQAVLQNLNVDLFGMMSSRVNACLPSDVYLYHTDSPDVNCVTLLYFANLEWKPEWEGETIFAESDGKNIFYSASFVPGRLVAFNSSIPHKSSQPSFGAKYHRFVFNVTLKPTAGTPIKTIYSALNES